MTRASYPIRESRDQGVPVPSLSTVELVGAILARAARHLGSSGTRRSRDLNPHVRQRTPLDVRITRG